MAAILAVGAGAGIAAGVACSTVLAHVVQQAATMMAAALLSCLEPARRAISVDPARSLRSE
jgi:hypothetical protein